jgi:hypothetical protein
MRTDRPALHSRSRLRRDGRRSAWLDLRPHHSHAQPRRPVQRGGGLELAAVHRAGGHDRRRPAAPRAGLQPGRARRDRSHRHLHGDAARSHRRHRSHRAQRRSGRSRQRLHGALGAGRRARRPHLSALDRSDDGAEHARPLANRRHDRPALRQRRAGGRNGGRSGNGERRLRFPLQVQAPHFAARFRRPPGDAAGQVAARQAALSGRRRRALLDRRPGPARQAQAGHLRPPRQAG